MKGLWEGSWIRWRFEIRQLLQSLADVADDHHFRFFILCFFLDLLFRRDGALAQGSLQERFSFGGIWFSLFDIAAFFFWSSFKTTLDSFLLFLFLLFAFSCSFLSFSRAISFCLIDSRTNFGVGGDESNALDSEIHLIYLTVEILPTINIPSIISPGGHSHIRVERYLSSKLFHFSPNFYGPAGGSTVNRSYGNDK